MRRVAAERGYSEESIATGMVENGAVLHVQSCIFLAWAVTHGYIGFANNGC